MSTVTERTESDSPPGEGLPPNHRRWALFEERVAWWYEDLSGRIERHHLTGGRFLGRASNGQPISIGPSPLGAFVRTGDEHEAEMTWQRLEHWVRTGELPT